jgi:1-acyl-sn-glycerol-3-phosphate acyltransferase
MLRKLGKYAVMIKLGYKYIHIFKKIYAHPFKTLTEKYTRLSHQRQNYSNHVLEFLNIEIRTHGSIPKQDKILYAINHRSLLDIIVMEHIFAKHNKNGTWIAKQELFDAFYGDFFRYSGCISVDLENKKGLLRFFKQIKNILAKVQNLNIYIFPEGERHKGQGVKNFQSGASKIAKANKLDVVPVYINDTLEKVFKAGPYKEKKIVEVYIGEMIHPDELETRYKAFISEVHNG